MTSEPNARDDHTTPSLSFSKRYRLLSGSDFKPIFDGADIKASHPQFLLLAKVSAAAHPRLGLVIAKKHAKRAVDRNRIKRVVRESFRLRRENLPPIDVIVTARRGADTLNPSDLHLILNKLWKRARTQYDKR